MVHVSSRRSYTNHITCMHLRYEESLLSISKQSVGHGHAPSGEEKGREQKHPLVELQRKRVPSVGFQAVCRDSGISSCHTWSLLFLNTKEFANFFAVLGPASSAISLAHAVSGDANRQVLRKSQHLHPSDLFLLPALWRRFSKHGSRCTRSRCKSPVEQLRGGMCL